MKSFSKRRALPRQLSMKTLRSRQSGHIINSRQTAGAARQPSAPTTRKLLRNASNNFAEPNFLHLQARIGDATSTIRFEPPNVLDNVSTVSQEIGDSFKHRISAPRARIISTTYCALDRVRTQGELVREEQVQLGVSVWDCYYEIRISRSGGIDQSSGYIERQVQEGPRVRSRTLPP
ncbi:hypothetical protein Mapa_012465 [Marchantia paleacea]|nr:hypothetical protein Mapa_012465 [Marchantia paleacea]